MAPARVGIHLRGGLGNRLFAVAAAYGQAEASGRKCCITGVEAAAHCGKDFSDTVFSKFEIYPLVGAEPTGVWTEPANRCLCYDGPVDARVPRDTSILLSGYFQNEKYLEGRKADFVSLLNLPAVPVESGALFVHVRRGDYVGIPLHAVDLSRYFTRALTLAHATFGTRLERILLFSDDPAWAVARRGDFGVNQNVEVVDEPNETVALSRMAACELGGVCANSTFSWWGAYLGFKVGKFVTFPDTWFNFAPETGGVPFVDDVAFAGSVRVACA